VATKSLVVRFLGDTKSLHQGLDEVTKKTGAFNQALGAVAKIGAAIGVMSFFKKAIDEAGQAAKLTRQTNAVLKSTGEIAKVSSEQVVKLSEAMAAKTGIDRKTIQGGENVLLTFTKIRNEVGKGNDIFDQATMASLNMSTALGKDLQGSVVMIGKALQDPIKGITALSRAGVNFSAEQKSEIKALVAKGDALGAQKIILKELNTEFGGMAEASASSSGKMKAAYAALQEHIGKLFLPAMGAIFRWITANIIPAAQRLSDVLAARLAPIIKFIGGWIRDNVVPVLKDMWTWLDHNRVVLAAMAGAAGGLTGAAAAMKLLAAATTLWNAAMAVNPVLLIIMALAALAAAIYYAWTHSATFRIIVMQVWADVQNAISVAWNSYIKPVFDALVYYVGIVASALQSFWQNVVSPVFGAIGSFVSMVWTNVLQPVLSTFGKLFGDLGTILSVIWTSVISPVFTAIGTVVSAVWTYFIQPIFGLIFAILAAFGELLWNLWNAVVFPVLSFIGGLFKWLWDVAIGPVVESIGSAISFLFTNVFKPIFEAIGAVIRFVWENVIMPVFEALKTGIDNVKKGFQTGSSGIEKIWNGLKAIVAAPINFIIGTVFNNGIRKVWNWIAEKIGIGTIDELPLIKLATGGEIHGAGGPKGDKIIAAVSNGEYVVNAAAYARNKTLVQAINAGRAFADGGPITYGPGGNQGNNRTDPGGGGSPEANNLNWSKFINDFLNDPLAVLRNAFSGVTDGIEQFRATGFGRAITDIPGKLVSNAINWLKDKVTGWFSTQVTSGNGGPAIGGDALSAQNYARSILGQFGWGQDQMNSLIPLWNGESGWLWWKVNPTSGATGIPQALPGSKMASAGPDWKTNPSTQINWGLGYIKSRYHTPAGAYSAWLSRSPHWYKDGGWLGPGQLAYNETSQPEAVLNKSQWNAITSGGNTYILNIYGAGNSVVDLREQFARLELMDAP